MIKEAIDRESDLILKLTPIPEADIFNFMQNLKGGTYFNMGMYNNIKVANAYKSTFRIYKIIEMRAIVSGVSYENISTTKEFRDTTGKSAEKSWYDHVPGFENKIGAKKSDPNAKYILWDIKTGSGTNVKYYLVDLESDKVIPITKEAVLSSEYLTDSEKQKLMPKPVVGFDLKTGEMIANKTVWRTAAFDHVFWLSQGGKSVQEFGKEFTEEFDQLQEDIAASNLFRDGHPDAVNDLDKILAGPIREQVENEFELDF